MDDLELEKHVDYAFKTPSGGILRMKNGVAIIIRGNDAKVLSSLEEYHAKNKDDARTWNELTSDQDKTKLYEANAAALTKIKWIEVETVVAAAQKLKTAETRRSLMADLLGAIVFFPLVVFCVWALSFGVERYFGEGLSHFQTIVYAALAASCMSRFVPNNPGRVTFIMAAFGYLLIVLVIWLYG